MIRPNPVKLADKLRMIAVDAQHKQAVVRTKSCVERIEHEAQLRAKSGSLNMQVWLKEFNLTRESAGLVAEELKRHGFHCVISNEITAMYSNTDWDEEDLMVVSWAHDQST